jgi:hypothetical protein
MAFNSIFTDVLDGNINDNNVINGTLLDDLIVGDNGKTQLLAAWARICCMATPEATP